jgi:phosphoenolpyruvate synthase/pyruvate phosphate dikinase
MVRYVYDFHDGRRDMADLLGGKGANLAGMTRLGLPVPPGFTVTTDVCLPGFTVTTDACRAFLTTGAEPEGMSAEVSRIFSSWRSPPDADRAGLTTRCRCPSGPGRASPCPAGWRPSWTSV